jgi:hypothetical protein
MFSFPLALVFGIVGIVRDEQKLLSIITTILAGSFVLFYLYMVFCRR